VVKVLSGSSTVATLLPTFRSRHVRYDVGSACDR
jgi:hypothetical protein